MKKNILSFALIFFFSHSVMSQITEGHISYSIKSSTDNPDMAMVISMLENSKMEFYFTKNNTRSEMSMGAIMFVTTIVDINSKEMLLLMDGNGEKSAFKTPTPLFNDSLGCKILLTEEIKNIQEFKCKKAIVTDSLGIQTIFWYTTEINVNLNGQSYFNPLIPGFPLEYEIINNGLRMVLTLATFEKKLSKENLKTIFELSIPEGYSIATAEELMEVEE